MPSSSTIFPGKPSFWIVASTAAVPTVGCPANGSSALGVKMRTRQGGNTNVVSGKLNSRAIACIARSERPCASGKTASWLPLNGWSVKTSAITKRCIILSMERRAFLGLAVLPFSAFAAKAEYPAVKPNPRFVFPRDHGAHPEYRLEWWYVTGWLNALSGPVGFQITFFRARPEETSDNP